MSARKSSLTPVLIGLIAAGAILLIVLIVCVARAWRIATAPTVETKAPTPAGPGSPTPFPIDALNLQDPKGLSNLYIEYILDASGSMLEPLSDGVPKREAAKEYLIEHLLTFAPETHFGLRAYGHRLRWEDDAEASCKDIELVTPIDIGRLTAIAGWLQDFETLGMTPLHAAVEAALEDFDTSDPNRLNNLILISDGIETCAGDPCGLVEMATRAGVNFTLHVVGLAVDEETRTQLSCMAEQGGGVYYDVFSSEELEAALKAISDEVQQDAEVIPYEEATQTAVSEAEASEVPSATAEPTATEPPTATQAPAPTDTPVPPTATFTPEPTETPLPTDTPTPTEEPGRIGLANPSSVYCSGLGYKEETRETDAGQYGVCIFPDGSECGSWDFLAGRCGVVHSYCVQQGYKLRPGENVGTCFFGDGTSCDEYEYFQGKCGPGG